MENNVKLLSSLVAASVKKLAESMLGDILKIEKQRQKVVAEQAKLDEMQSGIEDTNAIIKKKTGYTFDEIFVINKVKTGEKDGKEMFANKIAWRYPETYLPTIADDYDQMIAEQQSEEKKKEGKEEKEEEVESNSETVTESTDESDIIDVQMN